MKPLALARNPPRENPSPTPRLWFVLPLLLILGSEVVLPCVLHAYSPRQFSMKRSARAAVPK